MQGHKKKFTAKVAMLIQAHTSGGPCLAKELQTKPKIELIMVFNFSKTEARNRNNRLNLQASNQMIRKGL